MKERQASRVTSAFLHRETEGMVMPFTEIGKLREERKRIFLWAGVGGGDENL